MLISLGREEAEVPDLYYATLFLYTRVGPPSAEFCRTVAIFSQVDDLRFISPWAV